jgi:hypothetical protein
MTQQDQDAYRAAWAAKSKIAAQRGEAIDHVIWRDGEMTVHSAKPPKAPPPEPERPSSSRGVAQGLLI